MELPPFRMHHPQIFARDSGTKAKLLRIIERFIRRLKNGFNRLITQAKDGLPEDQAS